MPDYKNPGLIEFDAVIQDADQGGGYVEFPHDVEATYGVRGRVPVKATFDGAPYRGSMVRMGTDCHLLIILKTIRQDIGKGPGDSVHVTVELDTDEREVTLPNDVKDALKGANLSAQFGELSFSHQREHVMAIEEAKRPETRQRRIDRMLEMVGEKAR